MESVFILIIAGLTSVGMFILGVKWLRLARSELWVALSKVGECVGWTLVFFVLNLALAMLAILAGRSLIGRFISIYLASDTTLLILSWLQALTLQAWRQGSSHHMFESRGRGARRRES